MLCFCCRPHGGTVAYFPTKPSSFQLPFSTSTRCHSFVSVHAKWQVSHLLHTNYIKHNTPSARDWKQFQSSYKQPRVFTVSTGKAVTFGLYSRVSLYHSLSLCLSLSLSLSLSLPLSRSNLSFFPFPVHIAQFPVEFPSFWAYRTCGRNFSGYVTFSDLHY